MSTYLLLSDKIWHDELFEHLKRDVKGNWVRLKDKSEFSKPNLDIIKPLKIFIPHWSHIIPPNIYNNFECIVFHMTDLPYGRGGSPLQNLIVRGHDTTKISALKVSAGIDTGDIYLKAPLSLLGTAEEIFIRSAKVIEDMIKDIINTDPSPQKQEGKAIEFRRRKPEDGDISGLTSLAQVYDFIRMLDCEGYPKAYIEVGGFRFEFSRASFKSNNSIIADVRITKK